MKTLRLVIITIVFACFTLYLDSLVKPRTHQEIVRDKWAAYLDEDDCFTRAYELYPMDSNSFKCPVDVTIEGPFPFREKERWEGKYYVEGRRRSGEKIRIGYHCTLLEGADGMIQPHLCGAD